MEGISSSSSFSSSGSFYTPLVISVIGIISSSLALVIYHFVLIKYCLIRQQSTNSTTSQRVQHDHDLLQTGVDKKILETIPIMYYSTQEAYLFRVDQSECVVCNGDLEDGELVRLLPNCKHAFHVPCIDEWFAAHTSCPVCRSPVVAPANHPAAPPPLPPCDDGSNQIALPVPPQDDLENGRDVNAAANDSSSSGLQSCGMLGHCGSLVLQMEKQSSKAHLITGLKPSFSMDQSFVVIDLQREFGRNCSSLSAKQKSAVTRRLYRATSIKQFDRTSAMLLRSFSRLRVGNNVEILPY